MRGAGLALLAALALLNPPGRARSEEPHSEELPQIRRILIPPERVPAELERARQGAAVRMPRAEFEALLERAARASAARDSPPRLVEARYRAVFQGNALVGTAQWQVVSPGPGAGVLAVQPLGLALRQVRLDNADAVLGDLDGKALGLLVSEPGKHAVALDWTVRGDPGPLGVHFDLRVPACALSSFELDLPAEACVAGPPDHGIVTGPSPAEKPDRRLWRIDCPGRSQVDLVVQGTAASAAVPLVLARVQSKLTLTPGQLEAEFEYQPLEVLHAPLTDLVFKCDAPLKPYEVSIANVDVAAWEVVPGATPEASSTVAVHLREPFRGMLPPVRLRCRGPLGTGARWGCPGVRLRGSVPRGETLVLRVAPELQLEDWLPGDFRLVRARAEAGGEQVLTLQASVAPASRPPARPGARPRLVGPECRARQLAWWQVRPHGSSLTVQTHYEVVRGLLFRLPVRLPAGWDVDRVELAPPDLLRGWTTSAGPEGASLLVDLQRPLEPSQSARLTVGFRPTGGGSGARGKEDDERVLPFPEVVPEAASLGEGGLAISLDSSYQAAVSASETALPPGSPEAGDDRTARGDPRLARPWGTQAVDYYFPCSGRPLTGTLRVRSRPAQVRAQVSSEVVLASGRAAVRTRLLIKPEVGSPDTIDLQVSAPVTGGWDWKTVRGNNQVTSIERVPALDELPRLLALGSAPVATAGLLALPAHGDSWRVRLAHPLREAVMLQASFTLPGREADPAGRRVTRLLAAGTPLAAAVLLAAGSLAAGPAGPERQWEVPLVRVVGADPMEGEVRVHLAGTEAVAVSATGLQEVAPGARGGRSSPWRTFRFGPPPLRLALRGRAAATDRSAEALADRARLTTYVEPGGQLLHHFRFEIAHWQQRTFPLRLPTGARVLAARVDGRCLPQPPGMGFADGLPALELPVPAGAAGHAYEIVYATGASGGAFWTRVEAPAPELPVPTLGFRRVWCLAPQFLPVQEDLIRLPDAGVAEAVPGTRAGNIPWDLSADQLPGWFGEETAPARPTALDAAVAGLQAQAPPGTDWRLGDLVRYLAAHPVREPGPLVVDAVALREAGLGPESNVSATLEPAPAGGSRSPASPGGGAATPATGLILLPCRAAVLLTVRGPRRGLDGGPARAVAPGAEEAVARAAALGHDASGRFQLAADWLREDAGAQPPGLLPDDPEAGWVAWEVPAGDAAAANLLLARRDLLRALAVALAVVLALAAWRNGSAGGPRRRAVFAAGLVAAGLVGLALPPSLQAYARGPLLTAAGVVLLAYFRSAIGTGGTSLPSPVKSSVVAALVLFGGLTFPTRAAAPEAFTVWLLPGPAEEPDRQTALVPPELLDRLHALARPAVERLKGAVLLSAKYEGDVGASQAQFWAEMQVYSFQGEPVMLPVPLGGVVLQEALLDGAAAYPVASPPPRAAYLVRVAGPGAHTLRLRFTVPTTATGPERELHLTIPELPQSRLTLRAPEAAHFLQAVTARGAQQVTPDGTAGRLEADLGRVGVLHVRWRREAREPAASQVRVKEAYLWDLAGSSGRLVGLLQYSVSQGAVTTLAVDVPDGLEVHRVETGPLPEGPPPPRLKAWSPTADGGRRLQLEFQAPLTAGVQVVLELIPRSPLGPRTELPLPVPRDVRPADGPALLAYRTTDLEATVAEWRRVTGVEAGLFRQVWQAAGLDDPGSLDHAYSFRRGAGGAPHLLLHLQPPRPAVDASQELTWRVGPQQAALRGSVRLAAPDRGLALLEWDVPAGVVLTDVLGPEVRSWSRRDDRLQVWLQRSADEVSLELRGWLPRSASDVPAPFELPRIRPRSAGAQTTFVHVTAPGGWALHPVRLQHLLPLPDTNASDQRRDLVARESDYAGTFEFRRAAPHTAVRTLIFAEVREHSLAFVADLDCRVRRDDRQPLVVRLRHWEGGDVHLEAPASLARRELRRDPAERVWVLEPQGPAKDRYRLTITGSLPPEGTPRVALPDVVVDEAEQERWLAVAGPGLTAEDSAGVRPVADPARALVPWPAAAERVRRAGGSAWKVEAADWHLRLRLPPREAVRPVRLLLAEQRAAVLDGRHWVHQALYRVYHQAGADLTAVLPEGAAVLSVTVDGADVTPMQPDPRRLWLPLQGGNRVRVVRLRWTFPGPGERLDEPSLQRPRLENVEDVPALWTVALPAGHRLAALEGADERVGAAAVDLEDAQALLRATRAMVDPEAGGAPAPAELAAAQEQFYRRCRSAEQRLRAALALSDSGPRGQPLAAWLQELEQENQQLAAGHGFEKVRAAAEAQAAGSLPAHPATPGDGATPGTEPRGDQLTDRGTPVSWRTRDEATVPRLTLARAPAAAGLHQWLTAGLLALLLAAALVVACFPAVFPVLERFWPEELIVLGCVLAWQLNAWLPALVLVLAGAAARAGSLFRWLLRPRPPGSEVLPAA